MRRRIIGAYDDPIVKLYCTLRFRIMNIRILEELEQYIPTEGRTLDLGCGFGLFGLYYRIADPRRSVVGVDQNERRIAMARRAADRLGIGSGIEFVNRDVRDYALEDAFEAVVAIDLIHHLSPSDQHEMLERAAAALRPGGILLLKEVETRPWLKRAFTWLLDKLMDPRTPVHYLDREEMVDELEGLGFDVKVHSLLDVLPYPHILYIAHKRAPAG